MLCCNCKKNQAAKTYEQIKNGEKSTTLYCLDCYERLFLYVKEAEGEKSLSACPYCGATKEEIVKSKLVGCGYCYKTLSDTVLPMVFSMQGAETHKGNCPPSGEEDGCENYEQARFRRQCHELETVMEKLVAEKDFQGAKEYEEKLKRMQEKSEVEEEFVWRRPSLSKTLYKKT